MNQHVYQTYVDILRRELISAMGCTEPIALAYCTAVARETLGTLPERIEIQASGNIIKNVKSVVVPNTGGRRGIATAAAIGALGGDAGAALEVISHVSDDAKAQLPAYLAQTRIDVSPLESDNILDMIVTVYAGQSQARVRIANEHTNIVLIEKDGKILEQKDPSAPTGSENLPDYGLLTVQGIYDFRSEERRVGKECRSRWSPYH